MQQTSTLEPVFRVLFAMLAYAARTVAPNTNKLRHLPLSKYGQMHTAGLASLFGDFVFANVLTILKMLFLARCCCHQAPTPSLVQIWGQVPICAKYFVCSTAFAYTCSLLFLYALVLHFFIKTVNFSKASACSDSCTYIVSLWPDLKLRVVFIIKLTK